VQLALDNPRKITASNESPMLSVNICTLGRSTTFVAQIFHSYVKFAEVVYISMYDRITCLKSAQFAICYVAERKGS